ncbi:MAG: hypothetical protein ACE5FT_03660 [Candidatus Nanoarchaeia archaeon]
MKEKVKYSVIGFLAAIGYYLLFGGVTAVIANPLFTRMIDVTFLDQIFLISSSVLLGAYTGIDLYKKKLVKQCSALAYSGGVGSFLAFACPICNKLLVLLFGATALMTYLEPYRPVLGVVGTGLLVGAVYARVKY